ncbi:transporter substrate-binding domain-containing protein [Oecophyllibacter saccharovorans]|uniref:ABC transporter substrate-binding protein/permease n=1 Tax=Oecophyllibacter saccharovorans TaxID=2558360 RepID=UPI001143FA8D|nr:ABC transporter substrate-binding protein/permease [Oecophyllibacter saccharovorans]QDH16060.1 transporter substrate-binding domain-containing protein [Oecophyllibacter saccharovorans]
MTPDDSLPRPCPGGEAGKLRRFSAPQRPAFSRALKGVLALVFLVLLVPRVQAEEVAGLVVPQAAVTGARSADDLPWASDGEANVPYVFHDPAHEARVTGFEYDIMNAIGPLLHRKARFVQNGWDGLIPGLSRGLYAMVVDGIEMTPEHKAAVLFTRPYYVTSDRIVVRRNEKGFDTLQSLKGHTVGTIKSTAAERLLLDQDPASLRAYEEETDMFSDLQNGRLDAILIDEPIAQYYLTSDMKMTGPPIGTVAYGIAFAKNNPQIRDAVNAALTTLIENGTLHRILARWDLWTPRMAEYTGDYSTPHIVPVEWDQYRRTMATLNDGGLMARFHRYVSFLPLIGQGALMTIAVSALAMVLAVGLGLLLALGRHYGHRAVRWASGAYIEVVRGTPLLIQILFIFYGLPSFGIQLSPFLAGVVALGLNYAAYEAENYRAGLLSVPRGQMEGALALNMTHLQALRLVVVPQAFRTVVPVMTNDFISLLKDSSLVSVITLTELSQTYIRLSSTYYDYVGPGLMVGAAYILIGLPFVRLASMAEKRLGKAIRQGHH